MNSKIKKFILEATRIIPDRLYLKVAYRIVTGKKLHLSPPKTYNEKLQWLKLYNRNPDYTSLVDKYEVRKFISDTVGAEYLVPVCGVWNTFEEIDFASLPEKFVLKCTHDCGGLVICKDKSKLDIGETKRIITSSLKNNFYYQGREWPYKNVKPRIYAEMYMEDMGQEQLTDYKVFNFSGEPKIIQVDYDRYAGHKRQFYDVNWNRLDISFHFPSDMSKKLSKPLVLDEIIRLSKILSKGFPHLRTDFYIVDNKVYIGEMTFFHGTGFGKWTPASFDLEMGEWLNINNIKKKR